MPTLTLAELQKRFAIPGVIVVSEGEGGLTVITVTTPQAEAKIYTHGAHVTHFQPAGRRPILWMSGQSLFAENKAIRGGVPLIFPWFGAKADDAKAPMHGFARTAEWEIESIRDEAADIIVSLNLASTDATRAIWPHEFRLRYEVRIGTELTLSLTVENGSNTTPFDFEEALHTYLAVSDVRQVQVLGLERATYIDKTDALKQKLQEGPVTLSAETDRVYLATRDTCVVDDPGFGWRIEVAKQNSDATVVWNPWITKAKAMADFGDEEWPGMICVEAVNAGPHRVTLAGGAAHTMTATIHSKVIP